MYRSQYYSRFKHHYLFYKNFLIAVIISISFLNGCTEDGPVDFDPDSQEQQTQDVFTNGSAVKYWDNGDPNNRINIVFIGDGFSQTDQQKWKDHVDDMLDNLFSSTLGEPFVRYRKFFNVYRIDMISERSGLDPLNRNTPLRGERDCKDWRAGDCQTDWKRTHDAIDYYMKEFGNPETNLNNVGINTNQFMGGTHYPGRGWLNIYSTGHEQAVNIFIHEFGHLAGFLADEYVNDKDATYSGNEPNQANVTTILNPLKWQHWVGFDQPYTITNSPTIGTFEGALYVGNGVYRASDQCMMNAFTNPFCAICREKLILELYREVRPVDNVTVSMPVITVDLIDPDLFHITWFVNETEVATSTLTLDLSTLDLATGTHNVRIKVTDKILDYSNTGEYYDWVRDETSLLKQEINKQVTL